MDAVAPASIANFTAMSCPLCGERSLEAERGAPQPVRVVCAGCGAAHEAIADVTIVGDRVNRVGGCCAGSLRHELRWRDALGRDGCTRFETWTQDRVLLRAGDRASLLFVPGDLQRRKRVPMPLSAANHTLGAVWALPGSCAVERLR